MTAPASTRNITLISRVGCHLCDQARVELVALRTELGFTLDELDVDADPARADEYSDRVPVILLDGKEHGYWRVEPERLRRALQGRSSWRRK